MIEDFDRDSGNINRNGPRRVDDRTAAKEREHIDKQCSLSLECDVEARPPIAVVWLERLT